jgi:CspA family cold shock protein
MQDRRPSFFRDDAPPGRRVDAKVKWFNASKGFGFVILDDGTPDAFLPMAALRRAGVEQVREGAAITCEVGDGAKGPLVTTVLHVDMSTAVPPHPLDERRGSRPASTLDGAVKWFEPDRGYGFVAPDGGGKDVFVHITVLRRSGVDTLAAGQRVRVEAVDGRKGLEADHITLI